MATTAIASIPPDYTADHLLLLVGGNPPPNAVAGRLLLRHDGYVSPLHSANTQDAAASVRDHLTDAGLTSAENIVLCPLELYQPLDIERAVRPAVARVSETNRIGLNYTGGTKGATKMMAVHAHRALMGLKRTPAPWFSYLNPSTRHIHVNPDGAQVRAPDWPVDTAVRLTLDDVFALHGWALSNSSTEPALPRTAEVLLELATSDAVAAWLNWKRHHLRKPFAEANARAYRKLTGNVTIEDALPLSLTLPTHPVLAATLTSLRDEATLDGGPVITDVEAVAARLGLSAVALLRWLDGAWLETITLMALKRIAGACQLHDIRINLEPVFDKNERVHFELDVAALRGYQLFAFTCTTDVDGMMTGRPKTKLMEGYVRAQQLGGDEARVGLVTLAKNAGDLQAQLRSGILPEHRVYVFGRSSLSPKPEQDRSALDNLSRMLRWWIEQQSRGGA